MDRWMGSQGRQSRIHTTRDKNLDTLCDTKLPDHVPRAYSRERALQTNPVVKAGLGSKQKYTGVRACGRVGVRACVHACGRMGGWASSVLSLLSQTTEIPVNLAACLCIADSGTFGQPLHGRKVHSPSWHR